MAMQESFKIMSKASKYIEPNKGPIASTGNFVLARTVIPASVALAILMAKGAADAVKRTWFK